MAIDLPRVFSCFDELHHCDRLKWQLGLLFAHENPSEYVRVSERAVVFAGGHVNSPRPCGSQEHIPQPLTQQHRHKYIDLRDLGDSRVGPYR